jgi:ubiquinone/menaquinone biosynthesis C-methylase UbiE
MQTKEYKKLFEGKFTKTFKYKMGFWEKIYYVMSPATYNEKLLFNKLNKYCKGKNNTILDIGCGGGHYRLVKYGKVSGVDISSASLKEAKKIYHEVVEADVAKKIPYPNKHFNVIFCSEVFGHIEKKDKPKFMREIHRVLNDDGLLFFSIETIGKNVLTNQLKKKRIYKKYWIDYQGHIGLESPTQTRKRFAQFFSVLFCKPTSSHILPIDGYLIFSDSIRILSIFRNNILRRIINLFLMPFFLLSIKLSDFNSANGIVIVSKKTSN